MKSLKATGVFTIWTMNPCPHCVNAKLLLNREGCNVLEKDSFTREQLTAVVGPVKTLPQIIVDRGEEGVFYIGGYTDLVAYFNGTGPELRKLDLSTLA